MTIPVRIDPNLGAYKVGTDLFRSPVGTVFTRHLVDDGKEVDETLTLKDETTIESHQKWADGDVEFTLTLNQLLFQIDALLDMGIAMGVTPETSFKHMGLNDDDVEWLSERAAEYNDGVGGKDA